MAKKYSFKFYVSFVTRVDRRCALYKREYRVWEGNDDWKALMQANSKVEESFTLRHLLYRLLTTKTTMGEVERGAAVEDATLFWSVNKPNIQDSYPGDVRTLYDIFNQFKSQTSKRKMRMTLLFVNL